MCVFVLTTAAQSLHPSCKELTLWLQYLRVFNQPSDATAGGKAYPLWGSTGFMGYTYSRTEISNP